VRRHRRWPAPARRGDRVGLASHALPAMVGPVAVSRPAIRRFPLVIRAIGSRVQLSLGGPGPGDRPHADRTSHVPFDHSKFCRTIRVITGSFRKPCQVLLVGHSLGWRRTRRGWWKRAERLVRSDGQLERSA